MSVLNASFTVSPPRYQLPPALSLGSVQLQVANLGKSIAYYERVLGLQVITRGASSVNLGAQGSTTTLVSLHERSGVRPVPQRGLLGLYHYAIPVANSRFARPVPRSYPQPGYSRWECPTIW